MNREREHRGNRSLLVIGILALFVFAIMMYRGPSAAYANSAAAFASQIQKPIINRATVAAYVNTMQEGVGSTTALVRWDTDIPADALVYYQASTSSIPLLAMNRCDGAPAVSTHHCVELSDVALTTAYVWFIQSCIHGAMGTCDIVRYSPALGILPLIYHNASTSTSTATSSGSDTGNAHGASALAALPIKSISVHAELPLDHVVDGDSIPFAATLTMQDGSTMSGANIVQWEVVGEIGAINSSGVFTALLGPTVSEYGLAPGTVVATYSVDGKKIVGSSDIFNVYIADTPDEQDLRG